MIGTPGQRSRTSGCLVLLLDRCHRKSGGGFATVPFCCDVLQGIWT
jgi:hypothetical protein